jgi:hypothetical protein
VPPKSFTIFASEELLFIMPVSSCKKAQLGGAIGLVAFFGSMPKDGYIVQVSQDTICISGFPHDSR